jgi:hypothetical protein
VGRVRTPYQHQPGVGYIMSSTIPNCGYSRQSMSSYMVLDPLGAQVICQLGHLSGRGGEDILGESTSYIFKF